MEVENIESTNTNRNITLGMVVENIESAGFVRERLRAGQLCLTMEARAC